MRAGSMDRRVTLERATSTPDNFNQPIKTWKPLAEVWAEVRPISGDEGFESQQLKATAQTRFSIRYRKDVTPEIRVLYADRVYDVLEVQEIGRREGLTLLARARAE